MSDLLPPNATPQERAISLATGRSVSVPIRQLWSAWTCPAAQLPFLAWAMSVDEWDATWPETTKRQAIAASVDLHRTKGTIGALRSALQRLGYEVEIDENTGTAYTFRLLMKLQEGDSAGGAIADEAMSRMVEVTNRVKNARSELLDPQFLGVGGDAVVYVGAALCVGEEVDIKGDPSPLPLDGYREWSLGSFWTVRMHSDYAGPIGRVKRYSDNAEFDYGSSRELADFVSGSDWGFLRLYSQSGVSTAASVGDFSSPALGSFDGYGNPIMVVTPLAFLLSELKAQMPSVSLTEATIVSCGVVSDDDPLAKSIESGIVNSSSPLTQSAQILTMDQEQTSALWGAAGGAASVSPNPQYTFCAGAGFGEYGVFVSNSDHEAVDGVSVGVVPESNELRINVRGEEDGYVTQFYGSAFWKRDLGNSAIQDIIGKVNAKLQ